MIDTQTDKLNLTHGQKVLSEWLSTARNDAIRQGLVDETEAQEAMLLLACREAHYVRGRMRGW